MLMVSVDQEKTNNILFVYSRKNLIVIRHGQGRGE